MKVEGSFSVVIIQFAPCWQKIQMMTLKQEGWCSRDTEHILTDDIVNHKAILGIMSDNNDEDIKTDESLDVAVENEEGASFVSILCAMITSNSQRSWAVGNFDFCEQLLFI